MTNNQPITLPLDKLIEYIQSAYYEGINESIDNSMIDEEIDDYFFESKTNKLIQQLKRSYDE